MTWAQLDKAFRTLQALKSEKTDHCPVCGQPVYCLFAEVPKDVPCASCWGIYHKVKEYADARRDRA